MAIGTDVLGRTGQEKTLPPVHLCREGLVAQWWDDTFTVIRTDSERSTRSPHFERP